ncbi:glycosyltransferase family 4 protein [Chryseobacterium sp.]|uniref:glycosyltransferase family 4 protein n=1 Tax=Chryseobacterium sp. TaxID=1871047 RepID=UPI0025BB1E84|nr:glycosyltransferase family 4 protein [Chryseobacterium sp.]MBV8328642.1 glycosyltransferase family 4 protein [Chryseobacterium sp.]
MKIIIPLLGGFGKAGGWRVLSQLANYWMKSGAEVVFLAHKSTEKPYFPTAAEIIYYTNDGVLDTVSESGYPFPKLGALSLRRSLKKALNRMEADVVLATHSFTAGPVRKSAIRAKKFYYVQAYEPDFYYKNSLKEKIYKIISRKSYGLGLKTIVNAPMYLDFNEIKTDMYVFPGLDLDNFKGWPKKKGTKFILGTIGRLEEYKGTSYVVEAFRELRKEFGVDIELHMAFGDQSLAGEEGIVLITPQGDAELAEYYNSLDIYLCAGTIQLEAVHYPVIESMACQVPVITTGYLPADHTNAWMVPVKNSSAIAEKVRQVLKEDVIPKTEKAHEDIQIFKWENVSSKMLEYFKNR